MALRHVTLSVTLKLPAASRKAGRQPTCVSSASWKASKVHELAASPRALSTSERLGPDRAMDLLGGRRTCEAAAELLPGEARSGEINPLPVLSVELLPSLQDGVGPSPRVWWKYMKSLLGWPLSDVLKPLDVEVRGEQQSCSPAAGTCGSSFFPGLSLVPARPRNSAGA